MAAFNFFTTFLALTVTFTLFSDRGFAMILPCSRCTSEEECNLDPPGICVWGESRNACGRRVCSKGPGEKCGDKLDILGVCGEGMWCRKDVNRCYGCFIPTLECYPS